MNDIFNKTFFHLLLGFVSIVVASLVVVFSVGVYQNELAGDNLATPPVNISE